MNFWSGIVRLTSTGNTDTSFQSALTVVANNNSQFALNSIALNSNGALLIGGLFSMGTAGALALNARLLVELANKGPNAERCTPDELLPQLQAFLVEHGFLPDPQGLVAVTLAGKNVASFDLGFLKELPGWGTLVRADPAMLDPAAFYLNWHKDSRLPTMAICKARAGFEDHEVAHEALADALDVVRLLRPFYQHPAYKHLGQP